MITGGRKTGPAFLAFPLLDLLFEDDAFVDFEFFEVAVLFVVREEIVVADAF